jgi:hypothetical protein
MTAATASTIDRRADHLATAADLERVSAEVAATNPDLSAELAKEALSIRELVNGSAEDPTDDPLLEELVGTVQNLVAPPDLTGVVRDDIRSSPVELPYWPEPFSHPAPEEPSHFNSACSVAGQLSHGKQR